jgi:hypothetical protein
MTVIQCFNTYIMLMQGQSLQSDIDFHRRSTFNLAIFRSKKRDPATFRIKGGHGLFFLRFTYCLFLLF